MIPNIQPAPLKPIQRRMGVFVIDISEYDEAMGREHLLEGFRMFADLVSANEWSRQFVDIAAFFYGMDVSSGWRVPTDLSVPEFPVAGPPLIAGPLELAVKTAVERSSQYRRDGTAFRRPWLFTIARAKPIDFGSVNWKATCMTVNEAVRRKDIAFIPVASTIDAANSLARITSKIKPVVVNENRHRELFTWISTMFVPRYLNGSGADVASRRPFFQPFSPAHFSVR